MSDAAAAVVDLADLGLDEGGDPLLDRSLGALAPGQRLTVTGRHPALAVHLGAWCRSQGHRLIAGDAFRRGRIGGFRAGRPDAGDRAGRQTALGGCGAGRVGGRRLAAIGFPDDEAAELSALHTRNFM